MRNLKILIAATAAVALAAMGSTAQAATWVKKHPRQAEVLGREHHQIARINTERREGEITGAQAKALRASDRSIAAEDHADAKANGGYITKAEQKDLNAQENADSKTIGH